MERQNKFDKEPKEKEFVDSKPSNENVMRSLTSTFKNKEFQPKNNK